MSERGQRGPKPRDSRERPRPPRAETSWSVPVRVAEIPEAGQRFSLVAAADVREAVAKQAGVVAVNRLEATFDLLPVARAGLRLAGSVSASVVQACVVTLDPVTSEIEEKVDLIFVSPGEGVPPELVAVGDDDPPETIENGAIDLGAVAVEFLMLGIDPYPRKPGVDFKTPDVAAGPAPHPFAALAALKRDSGPKRS